MFILGTGCQWRAIPRDLPHWRTIYDYMDRWNHDGTLERMHHTLYVKCREQAGREPSPTAAVIDSQSVKSAEKDAMGQAARVRHHRRCHATDGEPHVSSR
jgi:transposase